MDINQWRLQYEGRTFDFGLFDDGAGDFPLKTQLTISDYDRDTQDFAQQSADGRVMGTELLGGQTLTFACTIIPDGSEDPNVWDRPLDLFRSFQREWRMDSVRKTPGRYASLTNLARNISVFGRTRRCAPTLDRIRKGGADWVCDFVTMDPNYYDTTWHYKDLSGVSDTEVIDLADLGQIPSWPAIFFEGPDQSTVTLQRQDSDDVWVDLWSVGIWLTPGTGYNCTLPDVPFENLQPPVPRFYDYGGGLEYRPTNTATAPLFVDTRPWSRGTLAMEDNSVDPTLTRAVNIGATLSEPFDLTHIPPVENLRLTFEADDAACSARVFWQKAYVSL